jgi:hypothetical protein
MQEEEDRQIQLRPTEFAFSPRPSSPNGGDTPTTAYAQHSGGIIERTNPACPLSDDSWHGFSDDTDQASAEEEEAQGNTGEAEHTSVEGEEEQDDTDDECDEDDDGSTVPVSDARLFDLDASREDILVDISA